MSKKINLNIALIATVFTITAVAAESAATAPTATMTTPSTTTSTITAAPATPTLSKEILDQCEAYLKSPNSVTPNKAALDECIKNDVCGTNGALTKTVPDCALNLNRWFWSSPTPNDAPISATSSAQQETPTVKTVTTVTPATSSPAPETTKPEPAKTIPEANQNNQEKDKKPSINWF